MIRDIIFNFRGNIVETTPEIVDLHKEIVISSSQSFVSDFSSPPCKIL